MLTEKQKSKPAAAQGDAYDFHKVRQLFEQQCSPVILGEETATSIFDIEDEELAESDDDYDAILEAEGEDLEPAAI